MPNVAPPDPSLLWAGARSSLFRIRTENVPAEPEASVQSLLRDTRDGRWATEIAAVRALPTKQERDARKGKLPAWLVQAVVRTREKNAPDRGVRLNGLLQIDFDEMGDPAKVRDLIFQDPLIGAAWLSPSGTGVKAIARCHGADLVGTHDALGDHFREKYNLRIDSCTKDAVRLCYVSHDPDLRVKSLNAVHLLVPDPADVSLDDALGSPDPAPVGARDNAEDRAGYVALLRQVPATEEGNRNPTALRLALTGRDRGLSDGVVLQELGAHWNDRLPSPLDPAELRTTVRNAFRYAKDEAGATSILNLPTLPPMDEQALSKAVEEAKRWDVDKRAQVREIGVPTDLDACARFVREHATLVRYCAGIGWLVWDSTRWTSGPHAEGLLNEMAKLTARRRTLEAMNMAEGEAKDAAMKCAILMEKAERVAASLRLARSDPRLAVQAGQLDASPWLLNCTNGTLDLRTLVLRPHDQKDLITKLAGCPWDPDATHTALTRALAGLRGESPDLPDFLARCFGSSLVGDKTVDALYLIQGDAGASKSTMTAGFLFAIGEYGQRINISMLCRSRDSAASGSEGASPFRIRLRGCRFAIAAEGDKAAKLDAGQVKELTGGERILGRGLFQEPVEFDPTWKLWVATNFDPTVDGGDLGMWRRLIKIHFPAIPEAQRDPTIREDLTTDPRAASAMLAWAARGGLEWQQGGRGRKGLRIPEAVVAATAAYRDDQDPLAMWWADMLSDGWEVTAGSSVPVAEVAYAYKAWCKQENKMEVGGTRFRAWMEARGFRRAVQRVEGASTRIWEGINRPAFGGGM